EVGERRLVRSRRSAPGACAAGVRGNLAHVRASNARRAVVGALSHNRYHARPMTPDALRHALAEAPDHGAWVRALARFFADGGACFGHGTDDAEDEAFWRRRRLRAWREGAFEGPPDPARIAKAVQIADRRVREKKPLAYLLGEAWLA